VNISRESATQLFWKPSVNSPTKFMTPEQALDVQIEKYRQMTGEERLLIALRLHELSCEVARSGIRWQNPLASEEEVERLLRERIALSRSV
jgi:hypothetical protein